MARGKNKLQKKERVASKLPISIPPPPTSSHHSHSHSSNRQPTNQTKVEVLHSRARKELISSSSSALKAAFEATEVLSATIDTKGVTQSIVNSNQGSKSKPEGYNGRGSGSNGSGSGRSYRIARKDEEGSGNGDGSMDEDEFNQNGEDDCDQ